LILASILPHSFYWMLVAFGLCHLSLLIKIINITNFGYFKQFDCNADDSDTTCNTITTHKPFILINDHVPYTLASTRHCLPNMLKLISRHHVITKKTTSLTLQQSLT